MTFHSLLIILGATASGKTKLAAALAADLDAEIISADSRQVFKDMDIGTGKDLVDYIVNGKPIPYHLINILEAGETYHVNAFKEDFYRVYNEINSRNKLPILCGGTGMYIHSILQHQELTGVPPNENLRFELQEFSKDKLIQRLSEYPQELRQKVDYSSRKRLIRGIEIASYLSANKLDQKNRPNLSPLVVGLRDDLHTRRSKILLRLDQRLESGLIEEVEMLINNGVSKEVLTFYGLEYKFITAYLSGELTFIELREKLGIAICQFAKRQMTFFRKMEKDGVKIHWLDAATDLDVLKATVMNWLGCKSDSK